MSKQFIIINDTLNIKNAHQEIVYQYHKGERVEIEATTEWYWCTRHGAVWFSQAKTEAELERLEKVRLAKIEQQTSMDMTQRQAAHALFYYLLINGQI